MRRGKAPGGYLPGDTLAHRVDPRIKLVGLLVATVASFGASAPWGLTLVGAGLVVTLVASRTSLLAVLRGLRPAALILAISLISNGIVLVGQPGISWDGVARSATAVVRIAVAVGFVLSFSATTAPTAITDALAALLSPLRRLGLPVGSVAMSASVALRFIPLTAEEVGRIRCAQRARGARLDEGGLLVRIRSWAQILVPLIVGLFRRADELASAMWDRCYTGMQTALMGPIAARDWALLAICMAWGVAALLV